MSLKKILIFCSFRPSEIKTQTKQQKYIGSPASKISSASKKISSSPSKSQPPKVKISTSNQQNPQLIVVQEKSFYLEAETDEDLLKKSQGAQVYKVDQVFGQKIGAQKLYKLVFKNKVQSCLEGHSSNFLFLGPERSQNFAREDGKGCLLQALDDLLLSTHDQQSNIQDTYQINASICSVENNVLSELLMDIQLGCNKDFIKAYTKAIQGVQNDSHIFVRFTIVRNQTAYSTCSFMKLGSFQGNEKTEFEQFLVDLNQKTTFSLKNQGTLVKLLQKTQYEVNSIVILNSVADNPGVLKPSNDSIQFCHNLKQLLDSKKPEENISSSIDFVVQQIFDFTRVTNQFNQTQIIDWINEKQTWINSIEQQLNNIPYQNSNLKLMKLQQGKQFLQDIKKDMGSDDYIMVDQGDTPSPIGSDNLIFKNKQKTTGLFTDYDDAPKEIESRVVGIKSQQKTTVPIETTSSHKEDSYPYPNPNPKLDYFELQKHSKQQQKTNKDNDSLSIQNQQLLSKLERKRQEIKDLKNQLQELQLLNEKKRKISIEDKVYSDNKIEELTQQCEKHQLMSNQLEKLLQTSRIELENQVRPKTGGDEIYKTAQLQQKLYQEQDKANEYKILSQLLQKKLEASLLNNNQLQNKLIKQKSKYEEEIQNLIDQKTAEIQKRKNKTTVYKQQWTEFLSKFDNLSHIGDELKSENDKIKKNCENQKEDIKLLKQECRNQKDKMQLITPSPSQPQPNIFRTQYKKNEDNLTQTKMHLEQQINDHLDEIQNLRHQSDQLQNQIQQKDDKYSKLQQNYEKILQENEKSQKSKQQLKNENQAQQNLIEKIENQNKLLNEYQEKELDNLKEQINFLYTELNQQKELNNELKGANEWLEDAQKNMQNLENIIFQHRKKGAEDQEIIDTQNQQLNDMDKKIKQLINIQSTQIEDIKQIDSARYNHDVKNSKIKLAQKLLQDEYDEDDEDEDDYYDNKKNQIQEYNEEDEDSDDM